MGFVGVWRWWSVDFSSSCKKNRPRFLFFRHIDRDNYICHYIYTINNEINVCLGETIMTLFQAFVLLLAGIFLAIGFVKVAGLMLIVAAAPTLFSETPLTMAEFMENLRN